MLIKRTIVHIWGADASSPTSQDSWWFSKCYLYWETFCNLLCWRKGNVQGSQRRISHLSPTLGKFTTDSCFPQINSSQPLHKSASHSWSYLTILGLERSLKCVGLALFLHEETEAVRTWEHSSGSPGKPVAEAVIPPWGCSNSRPCDEGLSYFSVWLHDLQISTSGECTLQPSLLVSNQVSGAWGEAKLSSQSRVGFLRDESAPGSKG